jgi:putative ABC transport system permease protein
VVFKDKVRDNLKGSKLRNSLVIFQFLITFLLITGSVIMYRQISYMVKKDLGFNKEQLLVISHAEAIGNRIKTFKESLSGIRDVVSTTASTGIPGHSESGSSYTLEGRDGQFYNMTESYIDYDFFETYDLTLNSGRSFKDHFSTDKDACIVNESALKEMNLSNPFAVNLINGNKKIPIVGVVNNFHFESVRNKIGLYVFRVNPENYNYGYVTIRLSKDMQPSTITKIEKIWNEYVPNNPIQFFFMDQDFAQNYKEEKQQAQLSVLFTILAIFIASLGLFGLTSYTIEQRTKEIGLRKIMGASVSNLFYIISKDFILLVVIAALIGLPVIYVTANKWLQNFYYRITLKPFDFLAGFIIALIIALITISYRTIKSANANPVDALKYE